MKTMRCIRIEQYGGPETLRHLSIPIPSPREDEVLVRLRYAGVNFMDVHTRQGKYASSATYKVGLPCTLGMEGAGEVVSVGDKVAALVPGDRVAWCISWGSYAEYAVVPASRLAKLPAGLGFDMAAAAMFHGCTAHYLAHDVARLGPDTHCAILAASGGIGQLLIQLAKRAGARVTAVTSTPEKAAIAKARGADRVCLYQDGGFVHDIREDTHGAGADVVFDPLGQATLRHSFQATRKRGLVVNFGAVSGPLNNLDPLELGEAGSLFLTRPRLADYLSSQQTTQRRADDVFGAILGGELDIHIGAHYAPAEVERAHAALESRTTLAKPLLDIGRF